MANHKSAIKRHKQSLKSRALNRMAKTRIKNVVKAVQQAVAKNDKETATKALTVAMSVLDSAAGKKVIHANTAARRIARLSVVVSKIA